MPVLVQVDFSKDGPFGPDMSEHAKALAESIATEPGLLWKIWTENEETGEAGGVYLFEDVASAEAYRAMHVPRLEAIGAKDIRLKVFDVNEPLTRITRGPLVRA